MFSLQEWFFLYVSLQIHTAWASKNKLTTTAARVLISKLARWDVLASICFKVWSDLGGCRFEHVESFITSFGIWSQCHHWLWQLWNYLLKIDQFLTWKDNNYYRQNNTLCPFCNPFVINLLLFSAIINVMNSELLALLRILIGSNCLALLTILESLKRPRHLKRNLTCKYTSQFTTHSHFINLMSSLDSPWGKYPENRSPWTLLWSSLAYLQEQTNKVWMFCKCTVRRGKAAAFEGTETREEVHSCDWPPSLSPSQGDTWHVVISHSDSF